MLKSVHQSLSRSTKQWRLETPNIPSDKPFIKHSIHTYQQETWIIYNLFTQLVPTCIMISCVDRQQCFQLTLQQKPVPLLTSLLGHYVWVSSENPCQLPIDFLFCSQFMVLRSRNSMLTLLQGFRVTKLLSLKWTVHLSRGAGWSLL